MLNEHPSSRNYIYYTRLIYLVLLIYGTLYPITEWNWEQGNLNSFFTFRLPSSVSKADFVMNLIVYIPFGFFSLLLIPHSKHKITAVIKVSLLGFLISFCLEFLQQFLPLRVTSLSDIFLNTLSTSIGAIAAFYINGTVFQLKIHQWKIKYLSTKPYSLLGISSVMLWATSQLSPFVPSLEISNLRQGIAPFWNVLTNPDLFNYSKLIIQSLYLSCTVIILRTSLTRTPASFKLIILFFTSILLLKIPVLSRQLSIEGTLGLLVAFTLLILSYQISFKKLKYTLLLFALTGYTISALLSGTLNQYQEMNWIPFAQQMNKLTGIGDLIEQITIFATIAFLVIPGSQSSRKNKLVWGSLFIICFSFGLEWYQQYIPGRYSDITDVLIAISTWFFCFYYPWNLKNNTLTTQSTISTLPSPTNNFFYSSKPIYLVFVLLIPIFISLLFISKTEIKDNYSLPEIIDLPSVYFANFKQTHPRLPAPNYQDIYNLEIKNKRFFHQHRNLAKKGNLYSRILIAQAYPGEINLEKLHIDLMALKFSWRGHQQTKPLALAYDWLYYQWTSEQRKSLKAKVNTACEYQINIIRDKKKLSPYNVYLYNSPFQALVMAALALHTNTFSADNNCMKFTHDYWVNRVLPVWRQVMGKNGGWHEGGEYVGIGIGQAIYQVPAMWKNATGKDFFQSETGIKGFLNFLIYRTRPDGTHMRWGDGVFFDRIIPDQIPLAIEYKHKAAYSLNKCPSPNKPSAYPWGPLTNDNLCDPKSIHQLPLTQYFDGLGMIIARSSWNNDATYVTFKAGDNYWSHSHLDQGSFTIYKGGALAIDSGLYGPKYGSDHHMNYSYQTIAHNVITVTDPEDNIPAPDKKDKNKSRPIANDGGQRRIGSGWGKAAPLDLKDWLQKKDIYHTGKIKKFYSDDNFVVAIANLTPAYTNNKSGTGSFSARTKRVDDYWRTFIYDREHDVVIVFDNITASDASYTKRSIFHTINRPRKINNKIISRTNPRTKPLQQGGYLESTVLFPKNSYINILGGEGAEFFVRNKNYDENGNLWNSIKKRTKNPPEPGSWRVEVIPSFSQKEDHFLTVYNPHLTGETKNIIIEALETDNQIGCRIKGDTHAHNFLFSTTKHNLTIELDNGKILKLHH